ncbi:MAG: hypothetical protein KJ685_03565 [Nanoarchaeota archaeon]|nr:hypothetical protein [Nanoarchaeota archaeon]
MKKKKFREVLRKLLGGIKKEKITTYDDLGNIIKVETITTKLSYLQIIGKLFTGSMIVCALMIIFINLYLAYALQPRFSYFRPVSFMINIGFLMFFMWLYSRIGMTK